MRAFPAGHESQAPPLGATLVEPNKTAMPKSLGRTCGFPQKALGQVPAMTDARVAEEAPTTHQIVVLGVGGSSPLSHPSEKRDSAGIREGRRLANAWKHCRASLLAGG
jgi:hypothetical protein